MWHQVPSNDSFDDDDNSSKVSDLFGELSDSSMDEEDDMQVEHNAEQKVNKLMVHAQLKYRSLSRNVNGNSVNNGNLDWVQDEIYN